MEASGIDKEGPGQTTGKANSRRGGGRNAELDGAWEELTREVGRKKEWKPREQNVSGREWLVHGDNLYL